MAEKQKKKKFSVMLSKIDFDGRILEVQGRKALVSLILLLFTAGCSYFAVVGDLPIFVRGMIALGVLISGYGFIDVAFGDCYLNYDCESGYLTARRGNPFGKVSFEGQGKDRLLVSRVRAGKGQHQVQRYTVVLTVKLDDAIINYPLENLSVSAELSEQKIREWEETLLLAD